MPGPLPPPVAALPPAPVAIPPPFPVLDDPPEPVMFRDGAVQPKETAAESTVTERSEKKLRYDMK
jgi:hypothetical protein